MNKREKILTGIISILAVIVVILSVSMSNMNILPKYRLENIDSIFLFSFKQAVISYRGSDENGFANENYEKMFYENAYLCSNIYSNTSYSNNKTVGNVVQLLRNTNPPVNMPIVSDELINTIISYSANEFTYTEPEDEINREINKIFDNSQK